MSKQRRNKSIEDLVEEALVPEEEQPYEVPNNWVWVKFECLNEYKNTNIKPSDFEGEIFELYSVPNYELNSPEFARGNEIKSNKQKVKEEDILLCKINPRINRVWKVEKTNEFQQIASTEWINFRVNDSFSAEYFQSFFRAPFFRKLLTSNVSGVGGSLTRAKPKDVKRYPVALPPIPEQKRIVNKIDRLFEKIDQAEQLIREVKESFELRQLSIIKRIIDEGKEDAVKRGWEFKDIKNIFNITGGGTPSKAKKNYWNGNIPWISAKDMKKIYINKTKDYITEEGLSQSSAKLVKKGSIAMVTRSGILKHSLPIAYLMNDCTVNQDLKVLDSGSEVANKFFLWYVKANESNLLKQFSKSGTTVNSIDFDQFKRHVIPLPKEEEMKSKIEKIELISSKEFNTNQYRQQLVELEKIKQSILNKAFRGELGTNDPTEESALTLLKEVLQEKIT